MSPRILALEPGLMIAEFYCDLLSNEGYEVTVLAQPVDDPHAIAALQPDLILLEFLVSWDGPGPQIIEKLKTHPSTATIPIIVCTGALHLLPPLESVLAEYHVPVITKPFQIDQFLAVIQQTVPSAPQHV